MTLSSLWLGQCVGEEDVSIISSLAIVGFINELIDN